MAGSLIGLVAALRVKMTAMPQMVALFNGFGGGASALDAGFRPGGSNLVMVGGCGRVSHAAWGAGSQVLDQRTFSAVEGKRPGLKTNVLELKGMPRPITAYGWMTHHEH